MIWKYDGSWIRVWPLESLRRWMIGVENREAESKSLADTALRQNRGVWNAVVVRLLTQPSPPIFLALRLARIFISTDSSPGLPNSSLEESWR